MFRVSSLHAAFLACITILVSSALASDTGCRYFPGDACWPNPAEWAAFNKTVNGRLIATIPIASVCHQNSLVPYNAAKCQQLQDNWLLPETHYTTSSSIMAQFFANFSCDPFTPPTAQCVLGTYVQYAVRAATLDDYKKTMAFATARNIRFVIRNTGHDYFGKSTGAGALALWTHHLKDTQFLDYQSRYYTGKAMRIGAGMQVREVIEAAHARGLVVAGAQCQSVGLAGGYLQGGGHSLMASQIGLGADQVLEWEAVTPRGQYLVATPDRNADLYWALAGGGGSTYAAVLSVTLKAFPDVKVAGATFTVTKAGNPGISDSQFSAILKAWLLNLPGIVDSGGAALWSFAEGFLSVTPVFAPNMTVSALRNLLSPTLRVLNGSGIRYSSNFAQFPTFLDAWNAMNPPQQVTDGNMAAYLLPRKLVTSESSASKLLDALNELTTGTGVVTGGLAFNVARGRSITRPVANSVNPVWNTAIQYLAFGLPYNRTSLSANQREWDLITNVYAPILDRLDPGGLSSYVNEGNPFDPNWKRVFYGTNYDRLLSIKDKYDPDGILYGRTSVGNDRWKTAGDGRLCRV